MELWQWSLVFLLAAGGLVWAGVALAAAGDEIAERTHLTGLLVGMLLVSVATSLPEIATVIGAGAAGAPDLAVGSLFGSSMANMAILAVIDLAHRQARVWALVELGHARLASVAIALTAVAVLGVTTPAGVTLGWVGGDTLLVALAYVAAVAWIRRSPRSRHLGEPAPRPLPAAPNENGRTEGGLRAAAARFALAALAVLVAGPIAALAGEGIVETSGLSETIVGVVLLAVATSLPELLASLAAVRLGAYDLAVGNLFGSNAFNMVVLLFADLASTDGPILQAVHPSQVTAGIAAIGLMALALAAIVHGEETRIRRLEPDAVLLLLAYAGALVAVAAGAS